MISPRFLLLFSFIHGGLDDSFSCSLQAVTSFNSYCIYIQNNMKIENIPALDDNTELVSNTTMRTWNGPIPLRNRVTCFRILSGYINALTQSVDVYVTWTRGQIY